MIITFAETRVYEVVIRPHECLLVKSKSCTDETGKQEEQAFGNQQAKARQLK